MLLVTLLITLVTPTLTLDKDPYQVLGVKRDAPIAEIKKSYKVSWFTLRETKLFTSAVVHEKLKIRTMYF